MRIKRTWAKIKTKIKRKQKRKVQRDKNLKRFKNKKQSKSLQVCLDKESNRNNLMIQL